MELMLAQLVKSTFKQYHEMVSQRETDVRDLQVFVGGAVFTVGGLAAIPAIPVEGKALALMGFGMVLSIMAIGYLIRIPGKPKKRQRAKALKPALNPN
jgi:hypothetical protein